MSNELDEKFVADDGISSVEEPATPAGGTIKKKKADVKKAVDPTAEKISTPTPGMKEDAVDTESEEIVEEVIDIEESIATMFEGMDLSEEFTAKVTLVFEAAVNEAATAKANKTIAEEVERIAEEMHEAAEESVNNIVENLDSYLDYVVEEWMTENTVAIEAGIKVEVAESLMSGLKGLFEEHNIDVNEETLDIVTALEEEAAEAKEFANKAITENAELKSILAAADAHEVFVEMSEGLSLVEQERFKVLSEKLNFADVDTYKSDLATLKESFFKKATPVVEEVTEEEEIITEDTEAKIPLSEHSSINALLSAFNTKQS